MYAAVTQVLTMFQGLNIAFNRAAGFLTTLTISA